MYYNVRISLTDLEGVCGRRGGTNLFDFHGEISVK